MHDPRAGSSYRGGQHMGFLAQHPAVGIEHDGKEPLWTFTGWRLVDLSKLRVRLKAEFQATNAGLYEKTVLSLPEFVR